MSKTALEAALKALDLDKVRAILQAKPALKNQQFGRGLNLLQFCCRRPTAADRAAARRQLKLAQWLVAEGFDPTAVYTTAPGEDGEEAPAQVSLAFIAVAAAQNNELARYFLHLGAKPNALFAAVWWGNSAILEDLVRHGADINEVVGATPLHMAVDLLNRGVERTPALARTRLETLNEMLRLGADPNIVAVNGNTPLHSVLEKDLGIAGFTLLLKHGANPDVAGRDGRTVREIASRKRDKKYAEALQRFRQ